MSDGANWLELLARYPLCRIVTVALTSGEVETSRVPLVAKRIGDRDVVFGHVARSSRHPRLWSEESVTVMLVDGAHAYVSPDSYEHQPAVPTWNYCSATLHGRPRILTGDELESSLRFSVRVLDPALENRLTAADLLFYRKMSSGVTGFAVPVERAEYREKLSAHRSAADQAGIRALIESRGTPGDLDYLELLDRM
ncbi:FMN-binding negative transcriptional regulator [Rhodococcus rhodochrous]|uniref:FMN-binding negative transcriptional regulator n=1 Tax=Rhodococcus rhodochrous TaxID=1829 RepID=UPI001E5CF266|nr:FMN-binding negative transcriptional regulator [Rhodococcus rhodochrous]MCD2100405.1 FMN-binding negative transcriptional regulator [Rhodococcus rhodochrous]MCD2124729.1 FMN-binding negative transcriptional regulator [Rhodococcus rhodochrous]MCQ4138077.1 FMN-binding negative transcriptional regulator [Rhodococcus rhodochrous]MDJ0021583.1 FMN-binding negative transcriptional regulator [Rhodococcus rhodochrous]